MLKSFSLFFIFGAISLNLFAAATVRITSPSSLSVTGSTDSVFSLNAEGPSGDGTIETSPAKVYVPMTNTSVADHDKYYSLYSATGLARLFDTTNPSDVINFPLTIVPSGTMYLYAAAKNPSSAWIVVQKYSSSVGSNQDVSFSVSPKVICENSSADCTTIAPTSATNSTEKTIKVYFFLSTSSTLVNSTVVPTTDGVFFDVIMSGRVHTANMLRIYLTNGRKGDSRVIFNYSADSTMTSFKKVIVFKHTTNSPAVTNSAIGNYTGEVLNRDFSSLTDTGQITVNQLTNGEEVTVSVAFVDKFGFASNLSEHISLTPVQIEELLKKQACYILTAGFGEEHFITNYFRAYRDQVLSHSWLGKKFIHLYYSTAPKYAIVLYQSDVLRFLVRGLAYSLYYLFNYSVIFAILLLSCLFLVISNKKSFRMIK